MLALAILGLLAVASPADTAVRVPGTTLRFGLDPTAVAARGFTAASAGVLKGRCRFFGLTSDATLTFEDGRLARAEFTASDASAYQLDYVHDQLTAMGYRKSCAPTPAKTEVCDWTARTHVRVEVSGTSLSVSVVPAGAATVAPVAARATVQDARNAAAERALARLRGTSAPARTPAPDTARSAGPATVAPPDTAPGVPAPPRLPRDTVRSVASAAAAVPVLGAVPVLPETLAVGLPGRASPYAPATLMSDPRCEYPATARTAGIQGRVWVLAFVDTDGRVIRAQLKSGIPVLNAAALECVKDWSFKPVAWRGAPCRYWVQVPVTFTVH